MRGFGGALRAGPPNGISPQVQFPSDTTGVPAPRWAAAQALPGMAAARLPFLVAAALLALSRRQGLRMVFGLALPPGVDALRDMGYAQRLLTAPGTARLMVRPLDLEDRDLGLHDADRLAMDLAAYRWLLAGTAPDALFVTEVRESWRGGEAFTVMAAGRKLVAAPELFSHPFVDWQARQALRLRILAGLGGEAGPQAIPCELAAAASGPCCPAPGRWRRAGPRWCSAASPTRSGACRRRPDARARGRRPPARPCHPPRRCPPMSDRQFRTAGGVLLLAFLAVLSLYLVRAPGTTDMLIWQKWLAIVREEGLVPGYATIVANYPKIIVEAPAWENGGGEYPPLAYAMLWAVGAAADALGLAPQLALKATLLLFHWASVLVVLAASGSLLLAAAFSAAVMLGGVTLGYTDILFAPFLIAAFWALARGRTFLALALLLLSCLVKWQSLVLAPFVALYLFGLTSLAGARATLRQPVFRQALALGFATVALLGAVFGATPLLALSYAMNHAFLSGLAMNLPWLEGYVLKVLFPPTFTAVSEMTAPIPPRFVMLPVKATFWLAFGLVLLGALRSRRTLGNCLLFSVLGTMTYCTFNTGVHENHWFLPLFAAFSLYIHERSETNRLVCLLLAVMANVHVFFCGLTGQPVQPAVLGIDLSLPFALLCVASWLLVALHARTVVRREAARLTGQTGAPPDDRAAPQPHEPSPSPAH